MSLITPSFGLIFWMVIGFGILFFILYKFAWPVIFKMINEREQFIQQQLTEAETVRQQMQNLKSEHQQLVLEAKEERDTIIADTKKLVNKMYDDAKIRCTKETENMMSEARQAIENEKMRALIDIKNEIGILSINVAEKILREELKDTSRQEEIINKWVEELKIKN